MRLKKTLFGNYRAKEVEEYIESLEEGFDSEIREKNEKIESLRKKIDALKNQEREIGEAVVYAKSLIIEAHEKAEKEAQEVLEKAQKDFLQVRSSILREIDELTKKRLETEKLYKMQKEKIKELLSQIGHILDEETLESQIDLSSLIEEASEEDDEIKRIFDTPLEEDEATRLFDTPLEEDEASNEQVEAESLFDEASLEAHEEEVNESDVFGEEEVPVEISAPQKEVVNIEQTFAKTGTDSSIPVTYFTFPAKKSKDESKEKEKKKGKIIKRLSRIKKDSLL